MVEALGIIVDRHPKGRPRKMEAKPEKNRMCHNFNDDFIERIEE